MSLLESDWTYDGKPGEIPRDEVRELVGDTDKNTKLVSDSSIELALDGQGDDVRLAASKIAEKISARFAKEATTKSGKEYSRTMARVDTYLAMSVRLRESHTGAVPQAAQLRRSTTDRIYGDNDNRRGAFRTGMFHTSEFDPRDEYTDQDLLTNAREDASD